MRRTLTPLALATALVLGGPALGQGAGVAPRDSHAAADRDKDGHVDRQEFHERQTDAFFFADGDKSGALSAVECAPITDAAFRAADKNGDGLLSLEEFHEARAVDFRAADADGSGSLSATEVEAASRATAP
jgi:hypothetical protein